jgi:hypothetical protein
VEFFVLSYTLHRSQRFEMKVVGKTTQDLRKAYESESEEYKAFAFGFAAGQAEKVHLGVCKAAMFRPGPEHMEWYLPLVEKAAIAYGLHVVVLDSGCKDTPKEIWICVDAKDVGGWFEFDVNSVPWHAARAAACGIPPRKWDFEYHLRKGYGERCD